MRRIAVFLALVLVLVSGTAHAGPTIAAGMQTVSFGADFGEYFDIPAGPGVAINVMFPEFLGFALDFTAGQKDFKEGNSGRDSTYTWLEAGPRFLFGKESSMIRPDFFFGAGSYDMEIGDLKWDTAAGGYVGFGFQEWANEDWFGRFQVKGVYWKSDTNSNDAAVLNVSILIGYEF